MSDTCLVKKGFEVTSVTRVAEVTQLLQCLSGLCRPEFSPSNNELKTVAHACNLNAEGQRHEGFQPISLAKSASSGFSDRSCLKKEGREQLKGRCLT